MLRFVTSYTVGGRSKGAQVDALDWDHAQSICDQRGFGEVVEGVLYCQLERPNWHSQDADAFTAALAQCGYDPPKASEFLSAPDEPEMDQ